MSSFRNIDVKSAHVQELQRSIQLELANRGYSSEDDPVMAEYIVVMLANQKTADQITSELQDLVGTEYDPSFTDWIWGQTQSCLDRHYASSSTVTQASTSTGASTFANATSSTSDEYDERRSRSPQATRTPRARDQRRSRSPAASNAQRGSEQRRARSNSPPPAPRGERMSRGGSGSAPSQRRGDHDEPFDGKAYWRQRAEDRRRNPPPPVLSRGPAQIFQSAYGRALRNDSAAPNGNAERELFPTSASTDGSEPPPPYPDAGISIFGRAGIPDPRAPAFVPSSGAAFPPGATQLESNELDAAVGAPSTSILSRIDPMLPNNGPLPPSAAVAAPETIATTGHSSDFPTAPTETSLCRWNLGCTNPMCPYSHASPANSGPNGDPNALVLSQQNCRFGARCSKDCTRSHVSPAVAHIQNRVQAPVVAPVSFKPPVSAPSVEAATLSMDAALPTSASSRPCRFGAACTRADCFFSHPALRTLPSAHTAKPSAASGSIPCRFGLGCTRADCYFSHPPGQRASAINGAGTAGRLQAFAQQGTGDEEMEVIIPGSTSDASSSIASAPSEAATAAPIQLST